MEHIVQFAVGIDDDRIQDIMEKSAAKQVMEEIEKFANGTDYNGRPVRGDAKHLKETFEEKIMEYINAHADEIMDKVVESVANRVIRTKKFRETIDRVIQ